MPGLSRLFRHRSVVGDSFVPFICSSDRLAPGLETLDEWIGLRDVGTSSLNIRWFLRWGMLGSMVAFSGGCDTSCMKPTFRRGVGFFADALETLDGSVGPRTERVVCCFLPGPTPFEDLLGLGALGAVWFRSALDLVLLAWPRLPWFGVP